MTQIKNLLISICLISIVGVATAIMAAYTTPDVSVPEMRNAQGATQLIASGTGFDGNALGSRALAMANSQTLATVYPTLVRIKWVSGTFALCIVKLKDADSHYMAISAALALTSTADYIMPCTGLIKTSGVLSVEVTTVNAAACAFDVYVYGIRL